MLGFNINQEEFDKAFPGFKSEAMMEEAIASAELAGAVDGFPSGGEIKYDVLRKRSKSADGGSIKSKAGKYGKSARGKASNAKGIKAHKTAKFVGAKKGAGAKHRKGAQGLDGNAKRKAFGKVAIKNRRRG